MTAAGSLDVTVVIPAYNRHDTVGRAVLSALHQTPRQAREVVVVDDGSSDGTGDAAAAAGARVLRQANAGVGAARNAGLRVATTTWVAFLDSDDAWLPGHLSALMDNAGSHVLVGSLTRAVPSGRLVGAPIRRATVVGPREVAWPDVPLNSTSSMVRREVALEVGGFGSRRRAEDLEFWLRLLGRGTGLVVPEVTSLYYEHAGQVTTDAAAMRRSRYEVLASFAAEPWCDEALLEGVLTADAWDDLRASAGREQLQRAVRLGARLVGRPRQAQALWETLRHRRQRRAA
jgi:GT2 family glycosyltransferase